MKSRQPAAIAIVFEPNSSKILLVKRRDTETWVLPGGGIDENELPSAAAKREVEEESGITVSVDRHVGTYHPINRLAKLTYVFACSPLSGQPSVSSESLASQYFAIDDLPVCLIEIQRNWIQDALKNLPEPINRDLHELTYSKLVCYCIRHPIIFSHFLWTLLKNKFFS